MTLKEQKYDTFGSYCAGTLPTELSSFFKLQYDIMCCMHNYGDSSVYFCVPGCIHIHPVDPDRSVYQSSLYVMEWNKGGLVHLSKAIIESWHEKN